jgi:spore coat protein H
MRQKGKILLIIISIAIAFNLSACDLLMDSNEETGVVDTSTKDNKGEADSSDIQLNLDNSYFENDDVNSIKYLYVTVTKDQGESKYTFSDLEKDNYQNDDFVPKVNIILQEGNEKGPQSSYYGYGLTDSNASIRVRGRSTRVNGSGFKSYKISLNKKVGAWDNFATLNLNKHPTDLTRMRNKLSFDYFKLIPNIPTLRTNFVHLYIKDLTNKSPDKNYVNYGLYTNIDQANKDYLKRAGLDPNGNLYKTVYMEFHRHEDVLKNVDDPKYDKKKFEELLEIKAGKDHSKLIKMLEDVNNENIDIDEVVNKHFDRENYMTWMAANLIMGNLDTYSQNFYLYSPQDSTKWYFIPWDYDSAWGYLMQQGKVHDANASWQNGLSNYGSSVLHTRVFAKKSNVEALSKKIEALGKIITKENTTKMLEGYYGTLSKMLSKEPDLSALPFEFSAVKNEMERISDVPEKNIKDYYESLKRPKPVFTGGPYEETENMHLFTWNDSYCPDGSSVKYDMQVAKDPLFKNIVAEGKDLKGNSYKINKLKKGTYFFRLSIKGEAGTKQITFDFYTDEKGKRYDGIRKVVIE